MPGQRLPMRKIRDVLRLSADGMSKRKIAASLSIGATAAGDCIRRSRRAGLSWPLPENLSDEALERILYPPKVTAKDRRPQPDWAGIHRELRRPGVTLQLLWEEHRGVYPDGYGYSRYCELYRAWEGRLSPTMRQLHVAGERMFVDYAARPSMWWTGRPVKFTSVNCLSPCWAHAATPMQKPPLRSASSIGSARTSGRSPLSAASRRRSFPTT